MNRGIVYVAWGTKHINEAIVSAILNKSGYSTCLLTDKEGAALTQQHFDIVKIVDFSRYDAVLPYSRWWRKQASLIDSPFDVTCYVDTDCFITGSIDLGFTLAEEGNFCTVIAPTYTFEEKGVEYVMSNGGVWFSVTPSPEIVDCFLSLRPSVDYVGDEGVISIACRRHLKHTYLPETFNICRAGKGPPIPIRIIHTRHPVGDPATTVVFDHYGNRFLT